MEEASANPLALILPWERQAAESEDAWDAFQRYCFNQRPPRRQRAVIGFATAKISQWSNDNAWIARSEAFDRHMAAIEQKEREEYLRESTRNVKARHLGMLHVASQVIQDQLDKLLSDLKQAEASGMSAPELQKWIEMVIKMDRLCRDQSTENTAVAAKIDLSKLSIDEVKQLRDLRKKAVHATDQEE